METLSFVLPAKTAVGLIGQRTAVLAERAKLRVSKNFFGGYLFAFAEYLCNCGLKINTKNIKNYSSILAFINHRNWLDDSLTAFKLSKLLQVDAEQRQDHVTPFYHRLQILKLKDLYVFEIAKLMHKKKNSRKKLPNRLNCLVTPV